MSIVDYEQYLPEVSYHCNIFIVFLRQVNLIS